MAHQRRRAKLWSEKSKTWRYFLSAKLSGPTSIALPLAVKNSESSG
jgi:hypothetical protein